MHTLDNSDFVPKDPEDKMNEEQDETLMQPDAEDDKAGEEPDLDETDIIENNVDDDEPGDKVWEKPGDTGSGSSGPEEKDITD